MALGSTEILLVIAVVVLLFGAAAIPKLARSLGKAQGEFQKAKREFQSEADRAAASSGDGAAGGSAGDGGGDGPSEEQIRRTARDLGIDDAGKTVEELKQLINQKLA